MIGSWFGTDFDAPATVLQLPADVSSGRDPGVCIVDQVVRGAAIVGRVTGDFGAVALRVTGGTPLRVTVAVHLDEVATRWWSDRVRPPRHSPERPRLVLLRAQGVVRGAALLARRQGWRGAGGARATVEFDLAAEEVDRDGLLVVELADAPTPAWAEGRVSPRGALGLRIDRISARPQPVATAPTLLPWDTGCDLAVLPPGGPREFRLDVSTVPPAPPLPRSPSNRWTRRKPARAGFKVLRAARRVALRGAAQALPARPRHALDVQAVALTSAEPMPVEVLHRRPGRLDLRLTGPAVGPVLVGLTPAHPGLSCRVVPGTGR